MTRKLPALVEPNTFFSWSENFPILRNPAPFFKSSQLLVWSENFLLLWNPTPFSADQKTSLSYGIQRLSLKVHSYSSDQKTSFSCGTQHIFFRWSENFLILWKPAPFFKRSQLLVWSENFLLLWNPKFHCGIYRKHLPIPLYRTMVQSNILYASTSTSVRSIYVLLRPF